MADEDLENAAGGSVIAFALAAILAAAPIATVAAYEVHTFTRRRW